MATFTPAWSLGVRDARSFAALALILPCACVFDSDRRATTDVTAAVASSFVFRGQTMTDRPVAQGTLAVNLPAKSGGTTSFRAFGNLDLDDDTGRAWMDSGHAGEFTQVELSVAHTERIGDFDVSAGLLQ